MRSTVAPPSLTMVPPRGMGTLGAIAALARWPNALIAAAGVALGAWWAGGPVHERPAIFAMLSAVALAAFANAVNDLCDVDIDRLAHPERPLPSRLLSEPAARGVAAVAAGLALVAASLSRPMLGALTIGVLAAMLAYSVWVKRFGLPGNVLVAVVGSLPFFYGGAAVGAARASVALVALAIPLHLAREIAKDLDDAAADAPVRRTLPVAHGPMAARVALVIALLAFCAMLLPWILRWPRLLAFIAPALVLCALGARLALKGNPGAPSHFKGAMILAMLSLVALRVL